MRSLAERAQAVRTREDLVGFLDALRADSMATGSSRSNSDLSSFIDAMAGWAKDMDGYYSNRGEDLDDVPAWRVLADMLMAARVYE